MGTTFESDWECSRLKDEIATLRQRVAELETLLSSSTKKQVELTAERDSAYKIADHYRAERDELLEANRIACEDLVARHDRIAELKQQRDELLKVVETAYKVASEHDDRLPFDWAVYCEMLYQTIASVKEK